MRNFDYTVGVLVDAYFKGTLFHGHCAACAVGNIVADACGHTVHKVTTIDIFNGSPIDHLFWTSKGHEIRPRWYRMLHPHVSIVTINALEELDIKDKAQVYATGYSPEELLRIEDAFEGLALSGAFTLSVPLQREAEFDSLMAVVDVLADIHGVDLGVKEEAKALFVTKTI